MLFVYLLFVILFLFNFLVWFIYFVFVSLKVESYTYKLTLQWPSCPALEGNREDWLARCQHIETGRDRQLHLCREDTRGLNLTFPRLR